MDEDNRDRQPGLRKRQQTIIEMNVTITRTKVLLPRRRTDIISRQRLLDMLDDTLDYRLTLVAAPAGYGKTSLLVDLAHRVEYPVCWLALDPMDKEFQRFITHFICAIQQQFPDFGSTSLSVVNSMAAGHVEIRQLVSVVVNDVFENISEHFVLVLDDYHLIDENEEINQFVSWFGQEMDENCHLVIASRTLLSLPDLPLMVGRSQVKGLSFSELAFRPDEIKALLKQNYSQDISDEKANLLASETEGWITGLLLSAETMWHVMSDRIRVNRVAGVDLYDYLAQQVLDQQPEVIHDFLLKTSLLEEFDASLCEKILGDAPGDESWPELISTVLQKNLFTQPLEDDSTWLRYHHLFRDFLQSRVIKEKPELTRQILNKLAAYYTGQGDWEKAYTVCKRLDDKQLTVRVLKEAVLPMMKKGQLTLLQRWMSDLLDEQMRDNPDLLARRGAASLMLGEVEKGKQDLSEAEEALREIGDVENIARTLAWQAGASRFGGEYQKGLAKANEGLKITDGEADLLTIRAELYREIGLGWYQLGNMTDALESLHHARDVFKDLQQEEDVARVSIDLGLASMQVGDFEEALVYITNARQYYEERKNYLQLASVHNNLGVLENYRGEYRSGYENFQKALDYARRSAYLRLEAYTNASIGDLFQDVRIFHKAREYYNHARRIAKKIGDPYLITFLLLAGVRVARKEGNYEIARQNLAQLEDTIREKDTSSEAGIWKYELGLLEAQAGELPRAKQLLGEAQRIFHKNVQSVEEAKAHLHLAVVKDRMGDQEGCNNHLYELARAGKELSSLHPLIVHAGSAKDFLHDQARLNPQKSWLMELVNGIDAFQKKLGELQQEFLPGGTGQEFQSPAISIRALGTARVLVNGKMLEKTEWVNQKAVRELFFYLLTNKEGFTKEAIGSALWPDSTSEQLKQQFKNAVYRLRRAIGKDMIIYSPLKRRYRFNRDRGYLYDVENFQENVDHARQSQNRGEKIQALKAAVALYDHPYLPHFDGIWIEPIRYQLLRDYEYAGISLAQIFLERGENQPSIMTCEKILAIDACYENACRIAMRAYAALGDRAGIARQYERCRSALHRELDTHPSPETEELYRALIVS